VIDDIVDTGVTASRHDSGRFFALVDKRVETGIRDWVVFPWEAAVKEFGPEENIRRVLEYIGEDPKREGLLETPARVVKSYAELFSGYRKDKDVESILKVFTDGACDEMVIMKNIDFVSFCEHHMLPFTGVVHVAYLPNKKVVGASKLVRLVDVYSRRLQIQERLGQQITSALDTYLTPRGSACVVSAHHQCMSCRGVRRSGVEMVTSSLTGAFLEQTVRQEFMALIKD
jgi:GTP cyclohydrolase I